MFSLICKRQPQRLSQAPPEFLVENNKQQEIAICIAFLMPVSSSQFLLQITNKQEAAS